MYVLHNTVRADCDKYLNGQVCTVSSVHTCVNRQIIFAILITGWLLAQIGAIKHMPARVIVIQQACFVVVENMNIPLYDSIDHLL